MPELIHELTTAQIEELRTLYQDQWWSEGRETKDVQDMLDQCNLVFGFVDQGKLVGFARVLSDFIEKTLIFDVFIGKKHQGRGLGRAMVEAILNHPMLSKTKFCELYCEPEMVGFYKRFGFTSLDCEGDMTFMRRPLP